MSKRLLVMLALFPLLLLAAVLALMSMGSGRFVKERGPTRVKYSGHERQPGGQQFVLFTFTNAEECAVAMEPELLVQSPANHEVWESTPLQTVQTAIVPRGRAFTFRVPVPEVDQPWRVKVDAMSRPGLAEQVASLPGRIFGKGRGYPPLQGAWASPVMHGAEPAPTNSQRDVSASSAP